MDKCRADSYISIFTKLREFVLAAVLLEVCHWLYSNDVMKTLAAEGPRLNSGRS